MKITEAANRNQNVINHLVNVWEASVRATHLFLSDDLAGVTHLIIAEDENGAPIAFMGIENGTLEMLFVAPKERGKGVGKRLILYGIERCGVERLAVNEQNPQAKGFYERMGFQVYSTNKAIPIRCCICAVKMIEYKMI